MVARACDGARAGLAREVPPATRCREHLGLGDHGGLPTDSRLNSVAFGVSLNQYGCATAIRTPEAPQRHLRPRHPGDLGRPFMFTASAAGLPHGFQAGISAQAVNMPVGPVGRMAVVADASPQTPGPYALPTYK